TRSSPSARTWSPATGCCRRTGRRSCRFRPEHTLEVHHVRCARPAGHDRSLVMRIVAALGGNALLQRGERPDASLQEAHVREAAAALLPLAREHSLVITHGSGPQVGWLAMESGQDPALSRPYPFDVLVAQTQGMIGYW